MYMNIEVRLKDKMQTMANSVGPDQSDLHLNWLPRPVSPKT